MDPQLVRNNPSVRFIVVAYRNSEAELASLFASLTEGASRAGVLSDCVLVSNDGQFATHDFPGAEVRVGQGNVGFASGVKVGLTSFTGDYVVIANPDLSISAEDASIFLRRLVTQSGVMVPVIHNGRGNVAYASYEDWVFSIGRKFAERVCRRFLINGSGELLPRWVKICGAFVGMPREIAEAFGPFDEMFFMYGEDRDLTRRLRQKNIPIRIARDVVVTHAGGGSGVGMNRELAIVRADSAIRIAYRRYGMLGVWLKRYDLWLEAMRKLGTARSYALAARRIVSVHWGVGLHEAPRLDFASLRRFE